MPELTPSERLQPCLLDRLTDDEPGSAVEGRDRRVMSMRQYRKAVLRDLVWLLNSPNKTLTGELDDYPNVSQGVLNYGMPDLSGRSSTSIPPDQLERLVTNAIERYEPRIASAGLSIRVVTSPGSGPSIGIEIEGELWAYPLPERLYLRTEVDLETGECRVKEGADG
jgi:type VI secretion system protein ImpF